ncbi:Phospholipid-lipopolysaccharide ABC transporter [Helicobacter heilmannii]|uniref:Phospholipid-lipopolysaccharide ABC transporter n=2 Tax=Helicobacter heilmannii TaxID=35817 RepID=A0A0K2Y7J3_HELHE|nr:ABC transporter ATP-binding protein [Helicobacter heilmannii]BDQ26413.1 ABC transporter permease [Helicobacter heilmannii]CCM11398.1 Phospholipid-lipopolysaccharide ABC transporter [Helicobacter heilmannii ASB1.4]CRF51056.1 Phospholipid-lipopolysaccharide ABC transporter [Helicobacter heilmannii]CRI34818.1 Phospholipid-lipopolysaccharide ABC transporter [Helicobacter heilmannii]
MKLFFRRFAPFLKGHVGSFVWIVLASLVVALSTAWGTYLVKPTLDDIFIKKDTHMLSVLPFLVIVAYLGKSGGIYIQTYFTNFVGLDIVKNLRHKMLETMLRMEMGFFNRTQKGELISRITNDIALVRASLSNYLAESVRELLSVVGLIGVVIYQSPKLSIVGLVIMPLAAIPLSKIVRKVKKLSKANQETNARMTARLSEIFHSVEVIKTSNGEKLELQAFQKENQAFFNLSLKSIKYAEISSPLMEFLGSIAIALVIYLGGLEVIKGHITVGAFFSFITALFMLYTPIKRLVRIASNFQEALVAGERIYEILERKPAIMDGAQTLDTPINSIVFNDVSLAYRDRSALVLQDISLDLHANQIVAFEGKSGSGKSSLVNLILRLYEPTSGEIRINNTPLQDLQQKSLRAQIGIVTQKVFIFSGSVAENVAYGLDIDTGRVKKCLEQAQAWEFVVHLGGIEATLEEFGANLSGGQRQRIAIARALYKEASVLIFDEATSALDRYTEENIKQTIYSLRENRLIIIISHNPNSLEMAGHVYHLEGGKLIN